MTRSRSRTLAVLVGFLAVTAAACGSDDNSTTAGAGGDVRTVEIDMADNAFQPDTVDVADGETVRFAFTNTGTVPHDAFIGDTAEQADHETEMREADDGHGGGHGKDETGDAITVEPGETGQLTHTFDETGTLERPAPPTRRPSRLDNVEPEAQPVSQRGVTHVPEPLSRRYRSRVREVSPLYRSHTGKHLPGPHRPHTNPVDAPGRHDASEALSECSERAFDLDFFVGGGGRI